MSKEEKIDQFYMKRATEFIDMLVDKGYMRDDVSREETRIIEEYVGYLLQSSVESGVRVAEITRKIQSRDYTERG